MAIRDAVPRYELSDGSSNKFWEIELKGKGVAVRYGKIGTEGRTTKKNFSSAQEAKASYDKQIREKERKGYSIPGSVLKTPKVQVTPAKINPKLEAKIEKSPDDIQNYIIYGDWLEDQGDERGDLIAFQTQSPQTPKAKRAAKTLIRSASIWGELHELDDVIVVEAWRWGFIQSVKVQNVSERSELFGGDEPAVDIAKIVGQLLDSSFGRFTQSLTVGIVDFEGNTYDEVIKAIARRPRPCLRSLFLGDFSRDETELNWSAIGNISPLYKSLPGLRSLTLRSGSMRFSAMNLPKLERLETITGGLTSKEVRSICDADWPELQELSLDIGSVQWGSNVTMRSLKPILAGERMPKLHHLGLTNSALTDKICAALPQAEILPQLKTLDLSRGTMGDEGVDALEGGEFSHLESIDVSENYLTDAGVKRLEKIFKKVIGADQDTDHGDPEDRYISGGE